MNPEEEEEEEEELAADGPAQTEEKVHSKKPFELGDDHLIFKDDSNEDEI